MLHPDLSRREALQTSVKEAMRARDSERLGALRMFTAAVKQVEVDERRELGDADVIEVLTRLAKQRRDSISQYQAGNRPDLAAREQSELDLIQAFLPAPFTETELQVMLDEAITATAAQGPKDMGKVMQWLRPKLLGRADMNAVSAQVRVRLGSG